MRDLIERFLTHVRDEGLGPMLEVEVEGDIYDGLLTGELAELITQMRESLESDDDLN